MTSNKVELRPDYQREVVWAKSQNQLLLDSLLRGIDVPKLYFRKINRDGFEYEVVDGQQRLTAIRSFIANEFPLSIEADPIDGVSIAGLKFSELSTPLQMALFNTSLDVCVLNEHYSDDDIDETFYRLQNGTPLNASEKRRVIAGRMREIVQELGDHKVFELAGFSDKRYAYEDTVAKILHIQLNGAITDIRPDSIKKTYESNRTIDANHFAVKQVKQVFNFLKTAFSGKASPKFKRFALITLGHLLADMLRRYDLSQHASKFADKYIEFELLRRQNEELDEANQDPRFAAYTDAARSDGIQHMQYRHNLLRDWILAGIPELTPKDSQRDFSDDQRSAVYWRDKGICSGCGVKCDESDFHVDHREPYSRGGKTILANAQLLCPRCNIDKGDRPYADWISDRGRGRP